MIFEFKDLNVYRLTVGELATNCYLITDKKSNETIITDPGDAADYIESEISRLDLIPKKIIATHGHFDHLLAALDLQLAYKIPFLIGKADVFLLKNLSSSANFYLNNKETYFPPKADFLPEKKLIFGKYGFEVLHTPGHTPGSICLYNKYNNFLISGDTLFQKGVGRTDFSYSSKPLLHKSILKLLRFSKNTLVLPGHGEETTISDEQHILDYTEYI